MEQAGTGPSRPHIQGSKIAKGHQSFKVFFSTALKIFLEKSLTTPKKMKGGPSGIFLYPVCRKTQKKLKGGALWGIFFRKVSQCRKKQRGTLWSRPALHVIRETFWLCSLGQQVKFEIL